MTICRLSSFYIYIKKLYSEYLKLIKYRLLDGYAPYLTGSPSSDLLQQNCYKVNNTKLTKLLCHLKSLNNIVKSTVSTETSSNTMEQVARWQLTCEQLVNILAATCSRAYVVQRVGICDIKEIISSFLDIRVFCLVYCFFCLFLDSLYIKKYLLHARIWSVEGVQIHIYWFCATMH